MPPYTRHAFSTITIVQLVSTMSLNSSKSFFNPYKTRLGELQNTLYSIKAEILSLNYSNALIIRCKCGTEHQAENIKSIDSMTDEARRKFDNFWKISQVLNKIIISASGVQKQYVVKQKTGALCSSNYTSWKLQNNYLLGSICIEVFTYIQLK